MFYKTRTASGPDGISSIMLRNTATSISSKLTTLFNLSLRLGKVPSQWKVIPIFKSGDPSNATNYCPISLLLLVSKVLERIIFNQISHHLSINRLLSKNQFGFRSGFSTQEAFLSVTNDWHQLLIKTSSDCCSLFLMLKNHSTLFPTPLSFNLCHLLASQDPYIPGLRTTLLVSSKGLLWMESHPRFLQFYQESHKAQYLVLYFSSSS